MSELQMDAAITLIFTWPGPGVGSGRSVRKNVPFSPGNSFTIPFIAIILFLSKRYLQTFSCV